MEPLLTLDNSECPVNILQLLGGKDVTDLDNGRSDCRHTGSPCKSVNFEAEKTLATVEASEAETGAVYP